MNRKKLARRTALGEKIGLRWYLRSFSVSKSTWTNVQTESTMSHASLAAMIKALDFVASDEEPGDGNLTLEDLLTSRYPRLALKSGPYVTLTKPPETA